MHTAVSRFAVQAQALFTAAHGRAAALRQCLHDGHVAFDAKASGALHFAVDVVDRCPVHVDAVAALHHDVVLQFVVQKDGWNVDLFAKLLAVAHTDDNGNVVTAARGAAGIGQHVAEARVGCFQRKATGPVHLAQYRYLVAANLDQHDVDLRVLDEAAT